MPKKSKTNNAGSRGGTSYWTIYRKSRNVSLTMMREEPEQLMNRSVGYDPRNTLFDAEPVEGSGKDDNFEGSPLDDYDEFMKTPILSLEEELDDIIPDSIQLQPIPLDKSRFDSKASEIFRSLVLRHPHLANVFIDDMLRCLQSVNVNVPKDHRTLLHTPTKPLVFRNVEPGVYWHFGFERLIDKLIDNGIVLEKYLTILSNMDGMPLAKSSKANFWPILISIHNLDIPKPFVIGIYFHESSKPASSNDYLQDYVADLQKLKSVGHRGIFVKKVVYSLDAPALAFIKDVQGHTGKHACNKCTIIGGYESGRVCFPSSGHNPRTDEHFRNHVTYGVHHKHLEPGPLEDEVLETDMIKDFLIDPLHAIDLGVVKKIMLCWTGNLRIGSTAPMKLKLKLNDDNTLKINEHLSLIQEFQPSEYNRRSRAISLIHFWKGAEFSCFLHCTGPVILKGILPEDVYENFLLLHVVTIVSCAEHKKFWRLSRPLFKQYVVTFKRLYGDYAASNNIHNLLHIYDDINNHQIPMSEYSTVSFESRLGMMKRLVRGGNRRLEQVALRVEETMDYNIHIFSKQLKEGMGIIFIFDLFYIEVFYRKDISSIRC